MGYVISCRHFWYWGAILVYNIFLTYWISLFQPVTEAPPVSPKKDEAKNKIEPEKKKSDPPINDDNALENGKMEHYNGSVSMKHQHGKFIIRLMLVLNSIV